MMTTDRGAGPRERMRYQTDQIVVHTDALRAQEPHLRSFAPPRGHFYIFGALVHIIDEFAFKIAAACSSASWRQKHKKRVMQCSCMGTSAPLCCWTAWFDGRNTKFQACEHIVQHDMLILVKSRLGTKIMTTDRGAGPRERMRYQTDQIVVPTDALRAQEPHLRSFSAPCGHF